MRKVIFGREFYYPDGLSEYLRQAKELKEFLQRGLECFEEETRIVISPACVLDNLVEEMKIYAKCVSIMTNCSQDTFLENSRPLEKMRKITQYFSDFRYQARDEQRVIRDRQLENLRKVADSSVTGLEFGIISNSIISHLIYSDMNDAKKEEQMKEADRYYNRESFNIYRQNSDALDDRVYDYYSNVYLPILRQSFQEFYLETFNRCLRILDKTGRIDLTEINNANYDMEASNSYLNGAYVITKEIIYKSLSLCPYNPNVYKIAYENKLLSRELRLLSIMFELDETTSIETNYVETEDVNREISCGRFPTLDAVAILENKDIDIDIRIISLFTNLEEEDKSFIKECILKDLNLKKEKDPSSFISSTIVFIKRIKMLLSSDMEIYQDIIDKAYSEEINRICQKFDVILRLGDSPESLTAYAKNNKKLAITSADITEFTKCYEIFATKKMKSIVSLVGGCETEKFDEYFALLNKNIGVEHAKHLQFEREQREHQREIERKKQQIKDDIQSLNKELASIGFILFGKKAKRKTEIKSLIAEKMQELNDIE